MKFSERIGKRTPKVKVQNDSMDKDLRNSLWSLIHLYFVTPMLQKQWVDESHLEDFIKSVWFSFLKEPIDTIPQSTSDTAKVLRESFYSWNYLDVYDFLEFFVNDRNEPVNSDRLTEAFNSVLKRELSAFRFVSKHLVPISNEEEAEAISNAISSTSEKGLKGVTTHLSEALKKLSDKKAPDYRNSIKESISALEGLCQIITGEKKAELGKALKKLKAKIPIHRALEQGFEKLYGYTSDGDGIRHAIMGESSLDQEDALYMLISCSAFINYLIVKAEKAGVEL